MKKRTGSVFDLVELVRSEVLAPNEFARLARERPHAIVSSRFVMPAVGRRDFGSFEVVYGAPILRRASG